MELTEQIAVALGLVTVALVALRSVWNYPFALAMVTLYFFIFRDAKLYSDALLQIFFFAINLYGWANWLRSRREAGAVVVTALAGRGRAIWLAGTLVASLAWGLAMARYTDAAAPVWDALIAGCSVAAQILQSRRKVECWVLWIAVDLISVPLYYSRGLQLSAGLYLVFLALAVAGLVAWWRALKQARQQSPAGGR